VQRLQDQLQTIKHVFATSGNSNNHSLALTKRSGFEIVGVFILLAVLAIVGSSNRSAASTNTLKDASQSQPISAQVINNGASTPTSPSATALPVTSSSSTSGVSSNVSSNTTNGLTSTHMTVNGQAVNVPANGSTQQTVNTPSGPISVSTSHTQSGNGSNYSSTITSTNIDANTSTDSNVSVTGGN
jgi:hypothetical protein